MANLNEQYIFQAKEMLRLIINTGQEGYIVGPCLKDLIIDKEIKLVEIYTSLNSENAEKLFSDFLVNRVDENHILVTYLNYSFLVSSQTEFIQQKKIKSNAVRRHYSSSLMDFLEQKMFSINTLAMGMNNVIYDCYNGRNDIYKKRIRLIYDNSLQVFQSDPIRMLEAISLVSETGFHLEKQIISSIKRKYRFIKNVSIDKISQEMKKIIEGKYFSRALKLLCKTKLYKKIPYFKYEIKRLYHNYQKTDVDTFFSLTIVRAKKDIYEISKFFTNSYECTTICNLAITNPKAKYDSFTLYSYGLEKALKANYYNYIIGKSNKKTRTITKLYNSLPIKKTCDLAFKGEDILKLYDEMHVSTKEVLINDIVDDVISNILNYNISNTVESIKDYVISILNNFENTSEIVSNEENDINNSIANNIDKEVDDNPTNDNLILDKSLYDINDLKYSELIKRQTEFENRLCALENDAIEKELNLEIERKIKQSGLLEGQVDPVRANTYETLRKVYYDILINDPRFSKLKQKSKVVEEINE